MKNLKDLIDQETWEAVRDAAFEADANQRDATAVSLVTEALKAFEQIAGKEASWSEVEWLVNELDNECERQMVKYEEGKLWR